MADSSSTSKQSQTEPAKTKRSRQAPPHRSKRAKAAGVRARPGKVPDLRTKERMKTPGKPRKWNRDKVVRYVCECYGAGELLSDILYRIKLHRSLFFAWRAASPEYSDLWAVAERDSADAQRDYVKRVSEGRDRITLAEKRKLAELIEGLAKNKKRTKSGNLIGFGLVQELEKSLRARNALQIDAAKWYAKTTDPSKFGERVDHTLSPGTAPLTIKIEFVAPAPATSETSK